MFAHGQKDGLMSLHEVVTVLFGIFGLMAVGQTGNRPVDF